MDLRERLNAKRNASNSNSPKTTKNAKKSRQILNSRQDQDRNVKFAVSHPF